jgi:hypothetical protein
MRIFYIIFVTTYLQPLPLSCTRPSSHKQFNLVRACPCDALPLARPTRTSRGCWTAASWAAARGWCSTLSWRRAATWSVTSTSPPPGCTTVDSTPASPQTRQGRPRTLPRSIFTVKEKDTILKMYTIDNKGKFLIVHTNCHLVSSGTSSRKSLIIDIPRYLA